MGGVAVTVSGLPAGTAANITLTGPGGFSQVMTASGTVDGLTPGTYTVSASAVSTSGGGYAPTAPSQSVSVPASTSRVPVAVTYAQQNSQLVLTVSGLPGGTFASVLVTNSFGYSQVVPATTTLGALAPGLYTIAASSVTSGTDTYAPNPASQQVQVTTGHSTSVTVTYAISVPGTVNLTIDALTITQSVQSYDDTVPLVANRDAYLRVFVRADQANTATPAVRVQLYQGANPTPVMTYTLSAPTASVTMSRRPGHAQQLVEPVDPGEPDDHRSSHPGGCRSGQRGAREQRGGQYVSGVGPPEAAGCACGSAAQHSPRTGHGAGG